MHLLINTKSLSVAYGACAAAIERKLGVEFVNTDDSASCTLVTEESSLTDQMAVLTGLFGENSPEIHRFGGLIEKNLKNPTYTSIMAFATEVERELRLKPFLSSSSKSNGCDYLVWGSLRAVGPWVKISQTPNDEILEVQRWYRHMCSLPPCAEAMKLTGAAIVAARSKREDKANYAIGLEGAKDGAVVTRFPPEPSGYLHIGHAKAVLLNQYFSKQYNGKLIIRFDDTNPAKEKGEYEDSILEDLELLGVKGDILSHTSDYFPQLEDACRRMLMEGKAYADNTDKETMAVQRMDGIPSCNRDVLIGENGLKIFEAMLRGEDAAQSYCIRARISPDNPNKAMRDPVIYRCNRDTPHHRTGSKYAAYPTYDFACPIVDSLEGVTHALRTNEYADRVPQYAWMLKAMDMRAPQVWEYSRLNFVNTLLSKRKLLWLVENGVVTGWDDPRMPTVRGIIRRGLSLEALREYIIMQGPSKNVLLLEWDKLWALNRKIIDPISPRHTALVNSVSMVFSNFEDGAGNKTSFTREIARHKKNAELGLKTVSYGEKILIERVDAVLLKPEMEVTLMDWGNVIVESIELNDDGLITLVKARLNIEHGDVRSTELKLTWLADENLSNVRLVHYDHVLAKKKLEEGDELGACLNPISMILEDAVSDAAIMSLPLHSFIQLERKGFYIVDSHNPVTTLISIPDGKAVKK